MEYTQKREIGFSLENATMFQIQDMFENEKPDIILKTLKRFNIKRTPIIISLKLGIVFLVMINNILVKVFIIDFNSGYGPGSQKPSL